MIIICDFPLLEGALEEAARTRVGIEAKVLEATASEAHALFDDGKAVARSNELMQSAEKSKN